MEPLGEWPRWLSYVRLWERARLIDGTTLQFFFENNFIKFFYLLFWIATAAASALSTQKQKKKHDDGLVIFRQVMLRALVLLSHRPRKCFNEFH